MKKKPTTLEYSLLVEELMKSRPDQNLVRKLMLKQGIPYSNDPIAQMGAVLRAMDNQHSKIKDSASL